jgi:2-methylisocitrate lyase-like PEP mutase family enzyme
MTAIGLANAATGGTPSRAQASSPPISGPATCSVRQGVSNVLHPAPIEEHHVGHAAAKKAERYQALHAAPNALLAGGCWDAGSAILLTHAGFQVLETSSAGVMFARGLPDGDGLATRDLMLENARSIAAAVSVPVTANLENGFGLSPDIAAGTIRLAERPGLSMVLSRIRRAAGMIRSYRSAWRWIEFERPSKPRALPFPFALTARADQYMHKRPNLVETIERAQQFRAAGADMVLAPGLTGREEIELLCRSVDRPIAAVVGLSDFRPNLTTFGAPGVRRVIVGSSLARVAYTGLLKAAGEMRGAGTFEFTEGLMPFNDLNDLFLLLHASHT